MLEDNCKCNVIVISFVILAVQGGFTLLYILGILNVSVIIIFMTCINFTIPSILISWVMYLKCKYSGVPKKEEYRSRLKMLNSAVYIWTIARLLRAVSSLWDSKAFIGVMLELQIDSMHISKRHNSNNISQE